MRWKDKSVKTLIAENVEISKDPITIVREKARMLTLRAFSKGWEGPPFDVFKLASMLDITIRPNEMVLDARLVPVGRSNVIIEYNPFQNQSRINFSVAHEIGHMLFSDYHEEIRNREPRDSVTSWELEFLCNIAASEILLPFGEFSKRAGRLEPVVNSVISLSQEFDASLESTFLRYAEVTDYPCIMIIADYVESNSLKVQYCKGSKTSHIELSVGDVLPEDSCAYDCIKSGWSSVSLEQWDQLGETRLHVSCIGLSVLQGRIRPRVGILVTPEFCVRENTGIEELIGDATHPQGSGVKIIAQVVNTMGGLGAGFGKSLASSYPSTKRAILDWKKDKSRFKLGKTNLLKINDDLYVFQMIAQKGFQSSGNSIPLKYEVLSLSLKELSATASYLSASVHMPYIGSGQAGGDWSIIKEIIDQELVKADVKVTVYSLPGSRKSMKKQEQTLTLF